MTTTAFASCSGSHACQKICLPSAPSKRPSRCSVVTSGADDAALMPIDSSEVSVVVVKLGSSVVAEDTGELRMSVVARICEEVAALHEGGTNVIVVTSGAIARGMHTLGIGARPGAIEQLQ